MLIKMDVPRLSPLVIVLMVSCSLTPSHSGQCPGPAPSRNPNDPPFPRVIQDNNNYQTHLEVNILESNTTLQIDEYLNYEGNEGMLVYYTHGAKSQVIFNFATNEVYNVTDMSCQVSNITDSTMAMSAVFGSFSQGSGDKRHIFGTAASLRFAANNSDVYGGNDTVRGIPVDKWVVTVCNPNSATGSKGKTTVTYYFTKPGWSMNNAPQGIHQLPVRIEVVGAPTPGTPGGADPYGSLVDLSSHPNQIHHVYDFINYQPVILDDTVFRIPDGVACVNRINTKTLPTFKRFFSYRAEIIDTIQSVVQHYDVWYDEDAKVLREDKRYPRITAPAWTTNPVTEIHDFAAGVRYITDHLLGNCTAHPLDKDGADSEIDPAFMKNGSLVIDMRDPRSFFHFNYNYVYSGSKVSRGLNCDVFTAIIPNYKVGDQSANATFEYYFLAQEEIDVPIDGDMDDVTNYPVQLIISVPLLFFTQTYNFYDFTEEHPLPSVFDISPCYDFSNRVDFKLTFPGSLKPSSVDRWKNTVPMYLAEVMQVSPLRVASIMVTSDLDQVFVRGSLLATSTAAQFTMSANPVLEKTGDYETKGIYKPDACAELCVRETSFVCKSFDLCQGDGGACRLNIQHKDDGKVMFNSTVCDHFSRTVDGDLPREIPLSDAYGNLEDTVRIGNLNIEVQDATGFVSLYTASQVSITAGNPLKTKPLPSLPAQFSFREEISLPQFSRTLETYVWYDMEMKLVRFDSRDPADGVDDYTTTHIHDFTDGVEYTINQVTEECHVGPLPTAGGHHYTDVISTRFPNGSDIITMATPLHFFYLDSSYKYIGEATVRGIKCDVWESLRTDFQIPQYNVSHQQSIFKFYFSADYWDYYTVMSNSMSRSQPIKLEIIDKSTGSTIETNFYDWDTEHHAMKYFDISPCFKPEQRKRFQITFGGQSYHPYLDTQSNTFLNSALYKLSSATNLSPLHFQKAQVTYDDTNTYLLVTMLGNVPNIALFNSVMRVSQNYSAPSIDAPEPEDCAAICSEPGRGCNSFDWCDDGFDPDPQPKCIVATTYGESKGDKPDPNGGCMHYSRSAQFTYVSLDVTTLYEIVVDWVYRDLYSILQYSGDGLNKTYLGTDIRDDIMSPSDPAASSGTYLRMFAITPRHNLIDGIVGFTQSKVSVADCAVLCIQENTFSCQAFDYKWTTGDCRLTSVHPDDQAGSVMNNVYTSIYSRFYTQEFTKFDGEVFAGAPDKTLPKVNSGEMCARACVAETSFRCESFQMCAGSCALFMTHKLSGSSSSTSSTTCSLYSRNHLYDYTARQHKVVHGHGDRQLQVTDHEAQTCAQACAAHDVLPNCQSFGICQLQRGETTCTLSTADPTLDPSVQVVDNMQCTLYTKANLIPIVNPGANNGSHAPSVHTTPRPPMTTLAPSCISPQISGSSSGTTAGIALGMLLLGLVMGGALVMLVVYRKYGAVWKGGEDSQELKPWDK